MEGHCVCNGAVGDPWKVTVSVIGQWGIHDADLELEKCKHLARGHSRVKSSREAGLYREILI